MAKADASMYRHTLYGLGTISGVAPPLIASIHAHGPQSESRLDFPALHSGLLTWASEPTQMRRHLSCITQSRSSSTHKAAYCIYDYEYQNIEILPGNPSVSKNQ